MRSLRDNSAASMLVGFMIATVIFSVSFYYIIETSVKREGDTTAAEDATFNGMAASLAGLIVQPGIGWYSTTDCALGVANTAAWDPDGVGDGRFGLGDPGCEYRASDPRVRNNLSYDKISNLFSAEMEGDAANGHVDYEEAKASLLLSDRAADFHLRSWPVLPSVRQILGSSVQDPNMKVLYIGDYEETHGSGGAAVPEYSVGRVVNANNITVYLNVKNTGSVNTMFTGRFEMRLAKADVGFELHTRELAPNERHNMTWVIRRTADWEWKNQAQNNNNVEVHWELSDKTGSLADGDISMVGVTMTQTGNQPNFILANGALYSLKTGATVDTLTRYVAYDGKGRTCGTGNGANAASCSAYSDWNMKVYQGVTQIGSTYALSSGADTTKTITYSSTGTYVVKLFNGAGTLLQNDTRNVVAAAPNSFTPTGGTRNVAVDPAVIEETRFIDALIQHFERYVYHADYATVDIADDPDGDIFPDIKDLMDHDLQGKLLNADGTEGSLEHYTTVIVGSNVDHNAMTSERAKDTIEKWVHAGGMLLVFGSDRQNVQWLQPLIHASIETGSGTLFTPDEDHPVLNTPNDLDYATYDDQDTDWGYNAGYEDRFTHIITNEGSGGDVLGIGNPGAFEDGQIILTSWRPYDLTPDQADQCPANIQPDSDCQALFLIHNLITLTYRQLYLDYGPPIPETAIAESQTRVVSTYHPQLETLVTLQLQVWAFSG